jgi:uncharacterized glyoxalase superfamily protein PhnB
MIMPILSVKDVEASVAFYEKLGFTRQMSMPGADGVTNFAIVELADMTIGLGTDAGHTYTDNAPGVQFHLYIPKDGESIDAHHARTVANGILIAEALGNAYWGDRTYSVLDPDGYHLTITQEHTPVDMEHVAAVHRGDASNEKT